MNIIFLSSLLLLGAFLGSLFAVLFKRAFISVGPALSFTGGVMLVVGGGL